MPLSIGADDITPDFAFHRMPLADFDDFARMRGEASMVRRLRRAERSRRKLLLYALLEAVAKTPACLGPLPAVEAVWELLARVEDTSPAAFDRLLTHPYTGSWAGYATRLLRNGLDGSYPQWVHLGHVHAIAAAAAIRAGLAFEIAVPLCDGDAALPSLGLARLPVAARFVTAEIRGANGDYLVSHGAKRVRVPNPPDTDAPGWWSVRSVRAGLGRDRFTVRLDDVDPYRGLYEPVPPQRLTDGEFEEWRVLLDGAWRLLVTALPGYARLLPTGLNSLVPKPRVLFRNPSASTGEAFGSAVLGRPTDSASLASTLVHEFQHIVLGSILHLTPLHQEDHRERFYVPWRDDPRPLGGTLQGVYAFFGVTAFWRALARTSTGETNRRAWFEFAYWRQQSWRTLEALRDDTLLTEAGQRFLAGMEEVLKPWQAEHIAEDITDLADATAADHRAGWRVRHLRARADVITDLVAAWLAGRPRPPLTVTHADLPPTPVPDGTWSRARTDLVLLGLTQAGRARLPEIWPTVPGSTAADFAYAQGRFRDAAHAYRAELAESPDRCTSLVGLGLSLAAISPHPAARALLHCPELVRATHRRLRRTNRRVPTPEDLAAWIGQLISGTRRAT